MKLLSNLQWIFLLTLIATCFLVTHGRRGGGGSRGGSRGSSSRGSSSRGSSSRTTYDKSRSRGESRPPSPPAPPPRLPDPVSKPKPPPVAAPKPSAPEVRQPAYNPNFRETGPNQPASNPNFRGQNPSGNQQPPPYSPAAGPPPPYSPPGQPPRQGQGPPPPYSPAGQQPPYAPPGGAPPAYSPPQGVPGANYPRQPGMPQSPGVQSANYPRQPGFPPGGQGSIPGGNYPRAPGAGQGGISGANYPRQPGGIPGANYPRQPPSYPSQTLGGHVWHPQSGNPAPAYMNYGGLPTGSNMYAAPVKKKGFLGGLFGMGASHKMGKQPKYYGSYPSPYGMGGKFGGHGGFSGKSAAMYTILPYMAARRSGGFFGRPRFGFMPIFLPSPFHHHHYYGGYGYHGGYRQTYYDVYNDEYVGRCNKPIKPNNSKILCNSTRGEVHCEVKCEEGFFYPDNTTSKENKCWHVTGVWRPTKNFPDCKPYCNVTCLNGGKCVRPGECGCPPEYRGPLCEHHFLKCDIRKLAGKVKIRWVCTHNRNETKCRIKCKANQEFITPPPEEYLCTPEGTWSPDQVPQCVDPDSVPKNETVTKEDSVPENKTDTKEDSVPKNETDTKEDSVQKNETDTKEDSVPKNETDTNE